MVAKKKVRPYVGTGFIVDSIRAPKALYDYLWSLTKEKIRELFRLNVERSKYVERDEIELQIAARAVVLEAGLDHMIYTRTAEWVALTGGFQELTELLIADFMDAKDELLKVYVNAEEFEITIDSGALENNDRE